MGGNRSPVQWNHSLSPMRHWWLALQHQTPDKEHKGDEKQVAAIAQRMARRSVTGKQWGALVTKQEHMRLPDLCMQLYWRVQAVEPGIPWNVKVFYKTTLWGHEQNLGCSYSQGLELWWDDCSSETVSLIPLGVGGLWLCAILYMKY